MPACPPLCRAVPLLAAALAAACSPALDWREVRPEGAVLVAWLPCKPERQVRSMALGSAPVAVELLACSADGSTWGLASAAIVDPREQAVALQALRAARASNLDGRESDVAALALPGVAPGLQALRFTVTGRRPDGTPVVERAAVFAHGGRVFHAAVLGGEPSAQAVETFFDNLKPRR